MLHALCSSSVLFHALFVCVLARCPSFSAAHTAAPRSGRVARACDWQSWDLAACLTSSLLPAQPLLTVLRRVALWRCVGRLLAGVWKRARAAAEAVAHAAQCRALGGSQEILDGVFLGADVKEASRLVGMGKVRASDVKFFYSSLEWSRGQLEEEMAQGKWVAAACSKDLILKPAAYWEQPLWRLVLEVMGGKFALISRNLCGDLWH